MMQDRDLRSLVGSQVFDQGLRPTCVAFASSVAHEALQEGQGESAEHLAPEALWWQAVNAGTASGEGMALTSIARPLCGHGQPDLVSWPYNADLGTASEAPPLGLSDPPWRRATLRPVGLSHDGVEILLEEALARSRPVILIVEVTDEFHVPGADGLVLVPDIRSSPGGYHAVTCVGVAGHPVQGRVLLVKNSWGVEWGLGGYCWLPVEYLVGFAVQAATVVDLELEC